MPHLVERARSAHTRIDAEARRRLPSHDGPLNGDPVQSDLHDERIAAILGIGLGVSFIICFITGMYSHLEQHPESWLPIPTGPAGLYRFTQGLHIAMGIASIPLLFAKLWTVWPRFFAYPPVKGVAHAVERISLLPLVGGGLFQIVTGVSNIFHWYWFHFFFTTTHYDAAYVVIGALLTHLLAKWTITRNALARGAPRLDRPPSRPGLVTRRGFIWTVGAASATLTIGTVGETLGQAVPPLQTTDVLAPRRPDTGPQGFPVNRPAVEAGVTHLVDEIAAYRLTIDGPAVRRPIQLSYGDLQSMPRRQTILPISCVEGWSVSRHWEGVRVSDLLELVGIRHFSLVTIGSVEASGAYRTSTLNPAQARAENTLLALRVNGEVLRIDHGYPLRLIAPNRPGVLQTKWVNEVRVS